MHRFIKNHWFIRFVDAEFGYSDVEANTSRMYAWLAKQLWHFVLGIALVFFFMWIADTITSFASLFVGCDCWPSFVVKRSDNDTAFLIYSVGEAAAALISNLILIIFALVLIATTIALLVFGVINWQPRGGWLSDKERSFYEPLSSSVSRVGSGVVLVLLIFGTLAIIYSLSFREFPHQSPEVYLAWIGIVFAVTTASAVVLRLCKDNYHFIFAMTSLFGALWIATNGLGVYDATRRTVSIILSIHFFVFPLYVTTLSESAREQLDWKEQRQLMLSITLRAAIFAYATIGGLEERWRLPVAGAICSLSIWWVKGFASDLPNVYREIAAAAKRRPGDILGRCRAVEQVYAGDARMEARNNSVIYLTGAWVGTSVVAVSGGVWASSSALIGLAGFLYFLNHNGEAWSFKQRALDLLGIDKVSRLAVFFSALRLTVAPKADEPVAYVSEPLDYLRHFSVGSSNPGGYVCDHVIIFGPKGSGVTRLGRAIATEAALSSLTTFKSIGKKERRMAVKISGLDKIRTSRFIVASELAHYMRDIKKKRDIIHNPTFDLLIEHGSDNVIRSTGRHDPKAYDERKGANLVVIDDLTTEALKDANYLDVLIDNLKIEAMQSTVWLVETGDRLNAHLYEIEADNVDDWEPDPEVFRAEIDAISFALARQAGGEQKICVGFVRRVLR